MAGRMQYAPTIKITVTISLWSVKCTFKPMRFILITFCFLFQCILYSQDYNILDYGAKADGCTLNTVSIQSAIDAASKNGGGHVVIPAGIFLTGSIIMKNGVELHLLKDAVLLGSIDPIGNRTKMSKLDLPLLVIHGERDNLLPVIHGQALYDASPSAQKEIFARAACGT